MFTRYHNWEAGCSFRSHSIDQDEDKVESYLLIIIEIKSYLLIIIKVKSYLLKSINQESIEITFEHFKMESTGAG